MEHTNNSYAKRIKIFGMILFLAASILSLLCLIHADPNEYYRCYYIDKCCYFGQNFTLNGNYCVNTFLSNGTFITVKPTNLLTALVVAGGGGGAGTIDASGGGGAGGYQLINITNLPTNNYQIIVGLGGIANRNGSNSSFYNIISIGGGAGGESYDGPSFNGGSGGGGSVPSGPCGVGWEGSTAGGNGTFGQGNNGGSSYHHPCFYGGGGGGGGAGAIGGGASGGTGGNGGNGLQNNITGVITYYAGGGGGGGGSGYGAPPIGYGGTGGLGGGGAGGGRPAVPPYSFNVSGTSGIPNTGGGGGAGTGSGSTIGAGGSGIVILSYLADNMPLQTFLNLPLNNTVTVANNVSFNFYIIPNNTNINNWTAYIWYPNNTVFNITQVTGLSSSTTLNIFNNVTIPDNDNYFWNVYACGTGGGSTYCNWGIFNRTLNVNFASSSIIISAGGSGTYNYGSLYVNHTVNYTINNNHLNNCWLTYNNVNTTIPCVNGVLESINFSLIKDIYTATIYTNDTSGNIAHNTFIWNYIIFENSRSYNNLTYETAKETFLTDVTLANDSLLTAAKLVWNGTTYASIKSAGLWNSTFDIPLQSVTATKIFYWNFTYNGISIISTNSNNQIVYPINFSLCDTSNTSINNVTFINFTYKDEMTYLNMNASVPISSFNYWLGSGSIYKTYFYSSPITNGTSDTAYATPFCFTPPNRSLNVYYNYQATAPYYVIRTFSSVYNITLSNATTNPLLYLISIADSGTVIIQVIDQSSGNVVPNARVTITRIIQGQLITIFDGYTDSAGTVAAFLSSVVSYTISASKPGCGSNTQTVIPVSSYNIQLACSGNITQTVSSINGVTYQHSPNVGISVPGNITYGYSVSSAIYPIYSAKFELYDDSDNLLASNQTDVSAGYPWCNSSICTLSIQYYAGSGDNVKGRYYVNLGNQTNYTYILLEKDAYWRYIFINTNNSQQAWTRAVSSFQAWMTVWGSKQTNCIIYYTNETCLANPSCKWVNSTEWSANSSSGFKKDINICVLKDDLNKMEFNRILIIFFGIVIVLFILGKTIGYEMTNPGSFVMYFSVIIFILSMGGLFTFAGLTPWDWLNQYIYAYICLTISFGYNLSIIRRYSM